MLMQKTHVSKIQCHRDIREVTEKHIKTLFNKAAVFNKALPTLTLHYDFCFCVVFVVKKENMISVYDLFIYFFCLKEL